jgi:hypothetical protein
MSREQRSVAQSPNEPLREEEEQRKSGILDAQRPKLAAERGEQEQRLQRERERRQAEETRAAAEREEQARLEALKTAEIERAREQRELESRLAIIAAERAAEQSRLALVRDARVSSLQGWIYLLGALLATLLVGALVIWAFVIRPGTQRSHEAAELAKSVIEQKLSQTAAERDTLERRLASSERRVSDLQDRLRSARDMLRRMAATPKGPGRQRPAVVTTRKRDGSCTCPDEDDPLCPCLR